MAGLRLPGTSNKDVGNNGYTKFQRRNIGGIADFNVEIAATWPGEGTSKAPLEYPELKGYRRG
jgi:hypothetical protein